QGVSPLAAPASWRTDVSRFSWLGALWLTQRHRSVFLGGAEGIRTPDLRSAIAALSQLSYSPDRPGRRVSCRPAIWPPFTDAVPTVSRTPWRIAGGKARPQRTGRHAKTLQSSAFAICEPCSDGAW